MKSISKAAFTILLAATAAWAQSASPSMAARASRGNSRAMMATSNAAGLAQAQQAQAAMHQRVEDMGNTLGKMHAVLKQMQAKNAATKDSMAKANLQMWGLMLEDLDKQYEQLRIATRTREEMEARRAAMYKQAEAKAAAEAQGIQAPGFARAPMTGATTAPPSAPASGSSQPSATQPATAPAQAPAPKANSPSSPN